MIERRAATLADACWIVGTRESRSSWLTRSQQEATFRRARTAARAAATNSTSVPPSTCRPAPSPETAVGKPCRAVTASTTRIRTAAKPGSTSEGRRPPRQKVAALRTRWLVRPRHRSRVAVESARPLPVGAVINGEAAQCIGPGVALCTVRLRKSIRYVIEDAGVALIFGAAAAGAEGRAAPLSQLVSASTSRL
jgi:hypothetical protein